jgi:hypothetical protein
VTPKRLALAGAGLLALGIILAVALRHGPSQPAAVPTTTATTPPPATTTQPAPPPPTTTAPPPAPPTHVAMSWDHAGAIVWHPHDTDPDWLGQQLRSAGFGWVAVFLGSSGAATPPEAGWILRFEQASGLPVGGWSVLGNSPAKDASLAAGLVKQDGLAFYIADAENPYEQMYGGWSRSQAFVDAFRAAEPSLPAGLSSFCNANGLDLRAWANAGFVFLPQAYVNDFGASVAPAECVRSAAAVFPISDIHPTVGSYKGKLGWVKALRFSRLLAQAGTTGFSVYPAETGMYAEDWQAYGHAIASLHIAAGVTG